MGIKEEYERYRPAYLAQQAEDRGLTLYGMNEKLKAMWTRIEALEAADSEQRMEIGRLTDENATLTRRLDEAARRFQSLSKQVDEMKLTDGQLGN